MPRIRTIKPEFPQSETVGRLTREARLLFLQLFTLVDDAGRARAAPGCLDVAITADGVEGLLAMSVFDDVDVVFDATSAYPDLRTRPARSRVRPLRGVDATAAGPRGVRRPRQCDVGRRR